MQSTNDSIVVSDPGSAQMSSCVASSMLQSTPTGSALSIVETGAVAHGPLVVFAAAATADARDVWWFSIAVPTRFTFSVSLTAASSGGVMSPQSHSFGANGGGAAGQCDGALHFDWSAFVATQPGALGVPFSAGPSVQARAWFRDPPSPKSTMLTDALDFVLAP